MLALCILRKYKYLDLLYFIILLYIYCILYILVLKT